MTSLGSNKRKTRIVSNNSKPVRPKVLQEKSSGLEGVYNNGRFMHVAASLVGCVVQLQSKNGNVYEGVFRTFSPQMDIVLEMAHLVDEQHLSTFKASSIGLLPFLTADTITEKLIFKLHDIVGISAINVDLDYAAKDNFTDTAISKFNGQVTERELEPWDASADAVDGLVPLEGGETNGWDVNDMFQTNAMKYGVTTSYDNNLPGYTVKLEQKNTDEYKRQEAKAFRIAQEIQSSPAHKARTSIENGNEEERFSAVTRPENNNSSNNRYIPQARRKNIHPIKMTCNNGPPPVSYGTNPKLHVSSQSQHVSSSNVIPHGQCKSSSSTSTHSSMSSPSPEQSPVEISTSKPVAMHTSQKKPVVHTPAIKDHKEMKVNGELDNEQKSSNSQVVPTTVNNNTVTSQPPPPVVEAARVPEKKQSPQKCRDDKTEEELKKFHAAFKLSEESQLVPEQKEAANVKTAVESSIKATNEDSEEAEIEKVQETPDFEKAPIPIPSKASTLNPNAETFTPRAMRLAVPLTSSLMQPPRIQASGQVMPLHHQIMSGLTQPIFAAMTPQYVMSATPVSVSLASPFHASSIGQSHQRYRKGMQGVPMALQPSHVAAATGPPILATPGPQLAVQYTPSGQPHMGYPQAYPMVGQRVMTPQPLSIMPSHTYGDTSHFQPQLFMSPHPGTAAISPAVPTHAVPVNAVSQGTSGPCSNASTPHSHAPSPVHQPPPAAPHVTPAHTPPTGRPGSAHTPQPVVYHGPLTNQHAVQSGLHGPNPGHSQGHHMIPLAPHHPHVSHQHNYGVPSQQLLLMSQQTVSASHPAFHGHPIHNQTASSHVNAHTHMLPHTVIPTNATMVHTSAAVASTVYVQHHQGV